MWPAIRGRSKMNVERVGTGALVAATIIVGGAIAVGGESGRILNGIGGLTWFASSGLLVLAARKSDTYRWQWGAAIALTAAVAFVIKPTDLTLAIMGFGGAGLVVGMLAKTDPLLWAKLIPALYLPAHIGTAVLKAVGRNMLGMESTIRSAPPPTATIVPFAMVVAAIAGGLVATAFRQRHVTRTRQIA